MYVNGFWLGFLVCILAEIVFILVLAILKSLFGHSEDAEIETHEIELPEELQRKLAEEIEKQMKGGNKKDGV